MANFEFKLPKAFESRVGEVMRTIEVTRGGEDGSDWIINGHVMPQETVDHSVAFAIRQRLANSFASAGTLKDKEGNLLSESDRVGKFCEMYDAVLAKLHDQKNLPSWESVFTGGNGEGSLSPFESQMVRLIRAGLVMWAKGKGAKLPKGDEYKALAEKYRAKFLDRLTDEANRALADAESDADDFDDFLSDDSEPEAAPEVVAPKGKK